MCILNKVLLLSLDVIDDLYDTDNFNRFIECLNNIAKDNIVAFVSHDVHRLKSAKNRYIQCNENYKFILRSDLKNLVSRVGKNYFIFLGNRNQDCITAVNNKMLYLCPSWTTEIEDKAKKYGIKTDNEVQLLEIIETVNNQNSWYSSYVLEDGSIVLSLMDGAYKYYSKSPIEKEMIENFEKVLKLGTRTTYFDILLYHFLAAISNDNSVFNDVSIWSIFPSSSCKLNQEMFEFKERVRYMTNVKEPKRTMTFNNLFIRHTSVPKSRNTDRGIRYSNGATKHLDSIHLNPEYKKRIEGSTVCVFDDFLNFGNSFEAARNLLKHAGAEKVILVSLGKFRNPYIYQEYEITGDIYTTSFTKKLMNRYDIDHSDFTINEHAKDEVENLHRIFNL